MSYRSVARAGAPLLVLALLAGACGKKGPLYLPDAARAIAPSAACALLPAAGECSRR